MKYALIGCGRIAINHMKAAINNNLDIVAVSDIIPEKMDSIFKKSDIQSNTEIKKYTDYKDMVKKEKPDLISIATESVFNTHCHRLFYYQIHIILYAKQRNFSMVAAFCSNTYQVRFFFFYHILVVSIFLDLHRE